MEATEIIQGNVEIALFNSDGYWQVWRKNCYKPLWAAQFNSKQQAEDSIITYNGVWGTSLETHEAKLIAPEYHKDWNALMPVVEKIESLSDLIVIKAWVSINGNTCGIWTHFDVSEILRNGKNEPAKFKVKHASRESKIKATWLAVVDFVKWYNQNK